MADEKTLEALQKSVEGTNLALGAISEVLTKNDAAVSRLGDFIGKLVEKAEKEEEEEKKKEEEDEEEESFAKLVKALEYAGFIRKDETALSNSGADSDEQKKKISSNPGEQQDVIQGAEKVEQVGKSITQPENLPKKTGALKKGDEEEKKEDKDEKKEEEYPEVEKLKKDLATAQAELVELKKSQDTKIQTAIEDVLSKMGFHREKKSFSPKPVAIGADQDKIQKSEQPTDRIGQMAQLSYAELRKLQAEEEAGVLPAEIKSLIS